MTDTPSPAAILAYHLALSRHMREAWKRNPPQLGGPLVNTTQGKEAGHE